MLKHESGKAFQRFAIRIRGNHRPGCLSRPVLHLSRLYACSICLKTGVQEYKARNHSYQTPYIKVLSGLFLSFLIFVFANISFPGMACANEYRQKLDLSARDDAPNYNQTTSSTKKTLAPVWVALEQRLQKNGIAGFEVKDLLLQLPPTPTQSPMGRKIRELYNKKFYPKPKSPAELYYKGVVTVANAQLCRQFIDEHQNSFSEAYARYGVPPAIASALLFVETRLGKVLGDIPENAFYTLASMAVSLSPDDISSWLGKLPGYEKHLPWLDETMRQRADWAFNELCALIKHMIRDRIPPSGLPGSIYGAVGLCQFMPSNISVYGADGNGDGKVDLFNPADAIASLANYLAKHGWKKGISREQEHKLLMTYNHSVTYANTIMALGDLVTNPAATPIPPPKTKKRRHKP